MVCKYRLLFCRLLFHFVDGFRCCAEAFQLNIAPFVLLLVPVLFVQHPKNKQKSLQDQCLGGFFFFSPWAFFWMSYGFMIRALYLDL